MLTQEAYKNLQLGSGGSYSLARDAIKHNLWDTRGFGTTYSNNTFFVQPQGAAWRVGSKTLGETNMTDSGKLPNGQTFLITHLSIGLQAYLAAGNTAAQNPARAFINLIHSSIFNIVIAGRAFDFQIHGSQLLPRPLAIAGQIATNFPVRLGDSIGSGIVALNPAPIFVDQLVGFSVTQEIAQPDTNVQTILNADATILNGLFCTMNVCLIGFLTRAK